MSIVRDQRVFIALYANASPNGQGNLYRQIKSESLRLKLEIIIEYGSSWYVYLKSDCDRFRGSTE
jgi:hypothetical protein